MGFFSLGLILFTVSYIRYVQLYHSVIGQHIYTQQKTHFYTRFHDFPNPKLYTKFKHFLQLPTFDLHPSSV